MYRGSCHGAKGRSIRAHGSCGWGYPVRTHLPLPRVPPQAKLLPKVFGCVHARLQQTVLRCGLMLPIAACSRSHALCPHPIAASKVQSNSPWEQNRLTVAKVATHSAKPSGAHTCAVCYKETQWFSRQMQSKQITSNHQDAKLVSQSHKATEDIKGSAPAG